MTLEILQVPGCPGADLLAARLDGLLPGRPEVTRRVVASQAEAERLGMTGSPTLLADGALPTMTLEILQVPGCPGADLLAARLDGLLPGRPGVSRRVVASQTEAERLGMTGSPTLLADGADPFARPGLLPAVCCRLYRDEHGRQVSSPSAAQLRAALGL